MQKSKTAIMTDTNSGITQHDGIEAGIYVLPMPVIIEGVNYLEGVTIDDVFLYQAMKDNKDIVSSQPSPADLMDMWDIIFEQGYEEIVYIPMSSGLSGSCHTAIQFAKEYGDRVFVVDNHRISVTLHSSVYDAKRMADSGKGAAEIKEKLENEAYHSSIYITVNSLQYLKKSGRVTAAGAAVANVINLKPVLTIQGEKLDAFTKTRGMKMAERKMIEAVKADMEKRFEEELPQNLNIGAAGTFENVSDAREWLMLVREAFTGCNVFYSQLSCSIASHVGVNAAGIGISRMIDINN